MQAHSAGSAPDPVSRKIRAATGGSRSASGAMTRKASLRQSSTRDGFPALATNRSSSGDRRASSELRAANRK
jgi:hypothetical protein